MSKSITVRLPEELLSELDDWIAEQPVPPTRSAVMLEAIRQFVKRDNDEKNER